MAEFYITIEECPKKRHWEWKLECTWPSGVVATGEAATEEEAREAAEREAHTAFSYDGQRYTYRYTTED